MRTDPLPERVLVSLSQRVMQAWGEKRHERVIGRFFSVEGSRIASAVALVRDLTRELNVSPEELGRALRGLEQQGLVLPIRLDGEDGYVPSPLGYWAATRTDAPNGSGDARQ